MLEPSTSDGSKSGVNWILRKEQSILAASARASRVFPTPGTSSIRTWPSASRATTASRMTSGLPSTTRPTFSISRLERESSSSREVGAVSVVVTFMRSLRLQCIWPDFACRRRNSINHGRIDSNGRRGGWRLLGRSFESC